MIRVLLVEDVRQTSELIRELLQAIGGFEVVGTCMTEHCALCWLEDNAAQADIAVVDLVLREGSGFSLLGRLTGYGCDAVVFSEFATPAVADKCRRMGALDAITKADLRGLRTFLQDYANRRTRARVPARRLRTAEGAS